LSDPKPTSATFGKVSQAILQPVNEADARIVTAQVAFWKIEQHFHPVVRFETEFQRSAAS